MHSAPPVQVPVGRFFGHGATVAALSLLSAGALGLAWLLSPPSFDQALAGGLLWVFTGLLSVRGLALEHLPPGDLCWDGQTWTYRSPNGQTLSVAIEVRLDCGMAMLLAVRLSQGPRPRCRYVWLRGAHMPGLWHRWRCAVYGRHIL